MPTSRQTASHQSIYRILDASANRAGEGLRTMEEMARFVLDDAKMTSEFKAIRHDLATTVGRLDRHRLLSARDTAGDVGTELQHDDEYDRASAGDIVAAAASRTTQSLRVIEEYSKTLDPSVAREIEQIRYRCYTITAAMELYLLDDGRRGRLVNSNLYVLIDAGEGDDAFAETVRMLSQAGVDVLQLRDRRCDDRTLIERARLGTLIAHGFGTLFIMNDRADLALAANTDGVHVGQEELPVRDARRILGPGRLVGVSTHSIEQARGAVADGADYIGCGPVFPGSTKAFDHYVGPQYLQQVSAEIELPAFAIGGINLENVDEVVAAGCRRIAVIAAVSGASDPAAAVGQLQSKLQ